MKIIKDIPPHFNNTNMQSNLPCQWCGEIDTERHDWTLHYHSVWFCPNCKKTTAHTDKTNKGRKCLKCGNLNYAFTYLGKEA